MTERIVVQGGTIVTGDSEAIADVVIDGEKIVGIDRVAQTEGAVVIDAKGLLVLPGAIDVHTHFETMIGGETTADDFESGSRAAAAGGVTCFINFAFQAPGESLGYAVERELAKARGRCHIDYSFHIVVTDITVPGVCDEINSLAVDGFTSIKIFTTVPGLELSDRAILRVLQAAGEAECLVAVHAEDGALVEYLTRSLVQEGKCGVEYLTSARPTEAEALAIERVATYARTVGCPLYVVHLSSAAALDAVRRARSRGSEVYVETRPAYLFLDASRYMLPDGEGNKFVTWPPLRETRDTDALWNALRTGEIQTYATDHTTWSLAQKMAVGSTFENVPGGVSNVQTSIGMLFNEGVQKGRLSLSQLVQISATNPAKLVGLWPRKGTIAVGSDADLMIIDPRKTFTVRASIMQSRSDFDPYEGYEAMGWPVLTMSRGKTVVRDGVILSEAGRGQLIRRARFRGM